MPGLPGTGLGGIFYLLLILWIAARESWLGLRGRSSRSRWGRIGIFGALLTGILISFWLLGWVVGLMFPPEVSPSSAGKSHAAAALTPALAILPLLILAALLGSVRLCRLFVRPTSDTLMMEANPATAAQSAPASQQG